MKLKSKTCTLRYILVLIFLYSNCLFANNISFYSTSDGLLSNNVVDIVQDTTGFVWFASDNGVSRFDGYNFKNYITDKDFSNKNIGIITDAYGVVVVISEKGIKRYCQFSNRFFDFDFNKKLSYFVKGNKNFIAGFEDGTLKYFEVNDDIVEIELEDQTINYNNIVLFDNGYIFQDSVNNIIKYNVKDKSKTIIYKSEISDLSFFAGNKANELLLLENKKLFKIDVDENNIKTPFFENNTIENICYSNNSYIINLKNDSKLKVIKNSSIISEVDIAELDISNVKKCYIDKHDNIWISHLLGGFSLITSKPNKFSFWNINASFLEKVTSIAICNNNKIYASTNLGSILKFDSSGKKFIFWQNTLKSAISKIQFDRDGNLWILSIDNNIIILDKNGNPIPRFYNQYIKSISQILDIKSFVLDSNSVWVANNEGAIFNINLLNNEKNEITFNNNDKDEALVNHLYYNEKNKQLYISTNHGIYVVDRNFKLKKIFSEIKYINCINIDSEGAIWIGSKLGLFKSKDESSNPILFKQSQDISINSIVITSKDDVWISTTNFLMYCPRNISALLRYDSSDGVLPLSFSENSSAINRADSVFMGGIDGICVIASKKKFNKINNKNIVITDIKLNHKSIYDDVSKLRKYLKDDDLYLSYSDKVLTMEFSGLNYGVNKNFRYEYMLENFDDDWISDSPNDRIISYTNLPGGTFIFKIRVVDSFGHWNGQLLEFNINIRPPFWSTWWFYSIGILLILFVFFLYYNSRIHRVQKMRRFLEKQVIQRTNELGDKSRELEIEKQKYMDQRDLANIQKGQIARQKEELEKQREMLEAVVDKRTDDLAIAKAKAIRSEDEKNKSESKYKLIAENARDMIVRIKLPEDVFDYVNHASLELTGYEPDEFYNNPGLFKNIVHNKYRDTYLDNYKKNINGEVVPSQEFRIVCKNGDKKWVCQRSVINYNDNKTIESLDAIIFDITDQKSKEAKYKAAKRRAEEASQLKSSFIANMSHGIRTPMNSIVGFADLLSDPNISLDEKTAFVENINNSSASLLHMVDNIIDVSKIEAGQMEISKSQCYINTLLEELYVSFDKIRKDNAKDNVVLKLTLPTKEDSFSIYTDNYRLRQIFMNLIGNALKYTHKGEIEIGYNIEQINDEAEDCIVFYVKDTGQGISKEKLENLFDRFKYYKNNSDSNISASGIGLAISKSLVELLDGKMWVESKENVGTCFWFSLPLEKQKGLKKKDTIVEKTLGIDWSDKTILIAEDEDNNFKFVDAALRKTKINLIRAKDGVEAYEKFVENKLKIDLILMDIQMPRMNGYEVTQKIKKLSPQIPIIAQTAFAMVGGKIKCFEAGCDGYISKPYKSKDLIDVLSKYF